MTVRIRRAVAADGEAMAAFRLEMEGGEFLREIRTAAYYRHKFLRAGSARVAVDGGRMVGVTSAVLRRVRIGDVTVPGADLGDLFVHPEYRGRGLFRGLHEAVLADLSERKAVLVTVRAGPGAASLLARRFGYAPLLSIAECVAALTPAGRARLPLGRVPLLRRCLPGAPLAGRVGGAGCSVEIVPPGDLPPCDALPADASLGAAAPGVWPRAGTVRDRQGLGLRYGEDPTSYLGMVLRRGREATGAAVLLVVRGRGFLVDAWVPDRDPEGARVLVRAGLLELRRRGAGVVHFWRARKAGSARDPVAAALRREGLRILRGRKRVLYRLLGGRPVDLAPPGEWMFRMGDTDGI